MKRVYGWEVAEKKGIAPGAAAPNRKMWVRIPPPASKNITPPFVTKKEILTLDWHLRYDGGGVTNMSGSSRGQTSTR